MAKTIVTSKSESLLESFVAGIEYVNDSAIEVNWLDDFTVVLMDEDDFHPDREFFIDEHGTLVRDN